jgi:hypothetical protein
VVQQGFVYSSEKVNIKSFVFCFDQMADPFHKWARIFFLTLDAYQLLSHWIADLEVYEKHGGIDARI